SYHNPVRLQHHSQRPFANMNYAAPPEMDPAQIDVHHYHTPNHSNVRYPALESYLRQNLLHRDKRIMHHSHSPNQNNIPVHSGQAPPHQASHFGKAQGNA